MKTSQRPISANGEAGSTSSLEDFRASLSVMPGDEEARRMTATSGLTCSAASTKSGPLGSWLRTLLASSRWSSRARFLQWRVRELYSTRATEYEDTDSSRPLPCNASATTLRVTDTKSSRCLFQLVPLEPPTEEIGSSSSQGESKPFLKTPCTADSYTDKMKSKGVSGTSGTLAQEVVNGYAERYRGLILPTPVVVDNPHPNSKVNENGRRYNNKEESSHSMGLAYRAHHDLLPTPRANVVNGCDLNNPTLAERNKSNLEEEVAKMVVSGMLPTPRTSEQGNASKLNAKSVADHRFPNLENVMARVYQQTEEYAENAGQTSHLSPLFTEEMMGFPFLWTTLPFLRQSGAPSPSKPTATP